MTATAEATAEATALHPDDMLNVELNVTSLIEALKYDHVSFILLFLYEELGIELGVPEFHEWIMSIMVGDDEKICIAIPRDHAKTTIAKIVVVWHLIYTDTRFPIYLSNTNAIAAQAVKDIANFIRSPLCVKIYGEPVFTKAEEAKGNYDFRWRGKNCILRSLGAGQQVRGMNVDNQRPDLAVGDDLESSEELESNKLGHKKLKRWFYGTFMKAMDKRKNKIIQIGNLTATKSILHDHLKEPLWKSVHMGAFTPDGAVLWPARWTLQELRSDLLFYMRQGQLFTWLSEMLNMPMSESNALMDAGDMMSAPPVFPDADDILLRCITVDPAISTDLKHAHKAVVAVHVFRESTSAWQLADIWSEYGVDPYALYDKIIEMAATWRVNVVGIEAEAYQAALLHISKHETARAGIVNMHFIPLNTKRKAKEARIRTWIGMIRKGLYMFSINDLALFGRIMKYESSSDNNDDDELDCCAYIVQMVSLHLGLMAEQLGWNSPTPSTSVLQPHEITQGA